MIGLMLALFVSTCIFAIGMKLNILQTLYFFIALTTTIYIFKFVIEYNYLDDNNNFNIAFMILGIISLLVALLVFGTNKVQVAWMIYIIYLVLIFSAFQIFGF